MMSLHSLLANCAFIVGNEEIDSSSHAEQLQRRALVDNSTSCFEEVTLCKHCHYDSTRGQCRNLHVGVPGYRPPKVTSTHFCWLVTDSATTFPKSTFEGKTRCRRQQQ